MGGLSLSRLCLALFDLPFLAFSILLRSRVWPLLMVCAFSLVLTFVVFISLWTLFRQFLDFLGLFYYYFSFFFNVDKSPEIRAKLYKLCEIKMRN